MDMKMFGGILGAFIVIVVGLAFLNITADTVSSTTEQYSQINEVTLTNGTAYALVDTADTLLTVASVTQGGNTLTVTTHYVVDTTEGVGTVNLTGVTYGTGAYNVSYTYQDANYIESSSARSMSNLIRLMFAIAIFISALAFVDFKSFGIGKN